MSQAEYDAFYEYNLETYARTRAPEVGVTLDVARDYARKEIASMLPDGRKTQNHWFFHLKEEGAILGTLWFAVRENWSRGRIFIYDIAVVEKARGRGCARSMLHWLEKKSLALGYDEVALHVLASNTAARTLYESAGYQITNLYMAKKLKHSGD